MYNHNNQVRNYERRNPIHISKPNRVNGAYQLKIITLTVAFQSVNSPTFTKVQRI